MSQQTQALALNVYSIKVFQYYLPPTHLVQYFVMVSLQTWSRSVLGLLQQRLYPTKLIPNSFHSPLVASATSPGKMWSYVMLCTITRLLQSHWTVTNSSGQNGYNHQTYFSFPSPISAHMRKNTAGLQDYTILDHTLHFSLFPFSSLQCRTCTSNLHLQNST